MYMHVNVIIENQISDTESVNRSMSSSVGSSTGCLKALTSSERTAKFESI